MSADGVNNSEEHERVRINEKMDDVVLSEDGLVFNPYNSLNTEITLNEVQSILSSYGLPPKVYNINLYKRAFVHRSYVKRPKYENDAQNIKIEECPEECIPLKTKSNERLEFLGDGVLECITKYYLYRRFPKECEGFMTEKKIEVVKNETIGKFAYEMGLHKWFIISKHAEDKKIRTNLKKIGCLFEAFIGALFLDYNKISIQDDDKWFDKIFVTGPGFQMAQVFLEKIFEKHIDWVELVQNNNNFKNILQIKIQKEFKVTPHYIELEHDPDEGYRMGVYLCIGKNIHTLDHTTATPIEDLISPSFKIIQDMKQNNHDNSVFIILSEGKHKIKRKAEQIACQSALDKIIDE